MLFGIEVWIEQVVGEECVCCVQCGWYEYCVYVVWVDVVVEVIGVVVLVVDDFIGLQVDQVCD